MEKKKLKMKIRPNTRISRCLKKWSFVLNIFTFDFKKEVFFRGPIRRAWYLLAKKWQRKET